MKKFQNIKEQPIFDGNIIFDEGFGLGKITQLTEEICEITYFKNNFKETFFPENSTSNIDIITYPLYGKILFKFQINEIIHYPSFGQCRINNFSKNGGLEVFEFDSKEFKKIGMKHIWKIKSMADIENEKKQQEAKWRRNAETNEYIEQEKQKQEEKQKERLKKQQEERNDLIENYGWKECNEVHDGKKCTNLHAPEYKMCRQCFIFSKGEEWYRRSYK